MKTKTKILFIFMMVAVLLSGCNKENHSTNAGKEKANTENSVVEESNKIESQGTGESDKTAPTVVNEANKKGSKGTDTLKPVDGATIGSMSSYVEDREIWKDFIDTKYIDSAKSEPLGIHVPRILLDSADAKAANAEIDGLVNNMREQYETNKKDIEGLDIGIYSSFSVYQDERVLSVMVTDSNIWEGKTPQYTVFNFSLPEGKRMDDDALMKHFGVEKDEILGVLEDSLREVQEADTNTYYRTTTDLSYLYNPNNCTGLILNDLWDNFESKSRQIYIDEVGTPTFIFAPYTSTMMARSPATLKLRADRFDSDPISPTYLRMARRLGINPTDEKHKAFVIYLGSAFDKNSLKEPLAKLDAWTGVFTNYEDPRMLLAIKESEGGNKPYLIGEECYLIIPKYENASISLKELEPTDEGKLKEVGNIHLDNLSATGNTFICQNISDIAPNAKITIRYRDDVLEFSPSISLKDGSLLLPEEVTDAEDILDWNRFVQKDVYSHNLFERILSIMGEG
ncbi:hypothetical protein [Murdochiella massiliensis]|uniref:hypothetical protein n=1 Tax=Murdochiella massiliensis TaxID=1673723 RepID=UPI0008379664|nr:hypothetical protein [Murdochiella massiliensis]